MESKVEIKTKMEDCHHIAKENGSYYAETYELWRGKRVRKTHKYIKTDGRFHYFDVYGTLPSLHSANGGNRLYEEMVLI